MARAPYERSGKESRGQTQQLTQPDGTVAPAKPTTHFSVEHRLNCPRGNTTPVG